MVDKQFSERLTDQPKKLIGTIARWQQRCLDSIANEEDDRQKLGEDRNTLLNKEQTTTSLAQAQSDEAARPLVTLSQSDRWLRTGTGVDYS